MEGPNGCKTSQDCRMGTRKDNCNGNGMNSQLSFRKLLLLEELKLKQILAPFFVAISGSSVSLPLFDSLNLLGPDLTEPESVFALDKLTADGVGLSKKGLKKLEKEYAIRYGNRID